MARPAPNPGEGAWQPLGVLVRSDRRWTLAVPPGELWSAATSIDRYRSWWPWLRHFEGAAFTEGARWRCVVKPPLPYTVRMTITLDEVREGSFVRAGVAGDVVGDAELSIAPHPDGSEARLVSRLAPASGGLALFARVARPLVRFGHDWVLDRGARQFTAGALRTAPADRQEPPRAEPGPDGPAWTP